ncbi:hypothetical protein N665_1204s0016 [Sinapis alba]|nr:hypothetical protein N665_1204s0016 [Sinapis alba]
MYDKNESSPRSCGISPDSLLLDRSNASSFVKFAKNRGILYVKVLPDKLRRRSSFSKHTDSGILPYILFPEKSMALKSLRIR